MTDVPQVQSPSPGAVWWTTSEVAVAIHGPYRLALDLILSGTFGAPERRGRSWLVRSDQVRDYLAHHVDQRA